MSHEIQIKQNQAHQAITRLASTARSLTPSFSRRVNGNNQLDIIKKINEINRTYKTLLNQYQILLTKHIEGTNETIETMMETDQRLATTFSIENR